MSNFELYYDSINDDLTEGAEFVYPVDEDDLRNAIKKIMIDNISRLTKIGVETIETILNFVWEYITEDMIENLADEYLDELHDYFLDEAYECYKSWKSEEEDRQSDIYDRNRGLTNK